MTLRFTCDEREILSNAKRSENIMIIIVCKILLLFVFLSKAPVVKNSQILVGTLCIFLKKRPRPCLKDLQYQIWTSVKRPEKTSSGKKNIKCSNFRLTLY